MGYRGEDMVGDDGFGTWDDSPLTLKQVVEGLKEIQDLLTMMPERNSPRAAALDDIVEVLIAKLQQGNEEVADSPPEAPKTDREGESENPDTAIEKALKEIPEDGERRGFPGLSERNEDEAVYDLSLGQLRRANLKRSSLWDPDGHAAGFTEEELDFRALELKGEEGEAANKLKKAVRHMRRMPGGISLGASRKDLADELADIIISTDRVAELLDIDLGIAVRTKFNKTSIKNKLDVYLEGPCTEGENG